VEWLLGERDIDQELLNNSGDMREWQVCLPVERRIEQRILTLLKRPRSR